VTEQAERLLEDPTLLEQAEQMMERLGLCGEEVNRRLVLLAAIGGHLRLPVHLVVHGESAGGKNTLLRVPLKLFPAERVEFVSGLSEQALPYLDEALEGVLVIDEAEGQKNAEYAIRQAMSEQRVARMTVNKDKVGRNTGEKRVGEVTASIFTTTTAPRLHAENQTRVFDIWIDETEEQTQRIVNRSSQEAAGKKRSAPVSELKVWREAIGSLKPYEVVIPFAPFLGSRFPTRVIRARRDWDRLLRLIMASALLHQRQRQQKGGCLVADPADYEIVYRLLQTVLEPSMSGLNKTALALCDLHDQMVSESKSEWVFRIDLEREATRLRIGSPNTVHDWCRKLCELGVWQGEVDFRRWKHRKIRDPREEPVALPKPTEVVQAAGLPESHEAPGGSPITKAGRELQAPPSRSRTSQPTQRTNGDGAPGDGARSWEPPLTAHQPVIYASHHPNWETLGGTCAECGRPSENPFPFCYDCTEREVQHV
jgi:hypothetical protein